MAGGGAQVTQNVSITINGATGDVQAIAREVVQELDRKTRAMLNGVFADTGLRTSGA